MAAGLLLAVALAPIAGRAQDDPTQATEPTATTESLPTLEPVPTLVAAAPDDAGLATDPTEPPAHATVPADPTDTAVEPSEAPEPTATTTAEPPSPITYEPAGAPVCLPAAAADGVITSGGSLDYDCTYDVRIRNAALPDPSTLTIAWTVTAAAGTWGVQLKPPATADQPDQAWTDRSASTAKIEVVTPASFVEQPDATGATARLRFGLRLHRPACAADVQAVTLGADAAVSLANLDGDSALERIAPLPSDTPYRVTPRLAPIPEPSVAFSGGLGFGDIPVDATGVRTMPAPASITVTVDGLDRACGTWRLMLGAAPLDGGDGVTVRGGGLELVSVNGADVAGGCALGDGCAVAELTAGPTEASVSTFDLAIALVLPSGVPAATFNSTLTASVTKASS